MQPIESIFFVHTAIRRDAHAIEQLAQHAESTEAIRELAARFEWFARAVTFHTKGEEDLLYPELEKRAPHVGAAYVFDHQDDQRLFEETRAALRGAREAAGDARREHLAAVRRLTAHVAAHSELHVRKENELVVPLVAKLFSPPEQGAQIQAIVAAIGPDDMRRAAPWLVGHLDAPDRVAYVAMMQKVMPPERFTAVAGWIREGIGAEAWTPIAQKLGLSPS
jgi:hypothetical protein